jgi:2-haloacid dehalogenase
MRAQVRGHGDDDHNDSNAMAITLAFDVYGTLIDTAGVESGLRRHVGQQASAFSQLWRDKQLEYSFRRGLMRRYANFATCTQDALDYACAHFGVRLAPADRQALLAVYPQLPAFDDVGGSLESLRAEGFALYAFSNGTAAAVDALLGNAGIRDFFIDVVSVDDVQSFKPNPDVYAHFLRVADADAAHAWLISGNPFDVIGALSAGMNGAWIRRSDRAVFDPWGIEPTLTAESLTGIGARILSHSRGVA